MLLLLSTISLCAAIPTPFFVGTIPGILSFGLQGAGFKTYNYLTGSQATGSAVGFDHASRQVLAVIDSVYLPPLVDGTVYSPISPSATTVMAYPTGSCDDWFSCTSGRPFYVSPANDSDGVDGDWADLTVDGSGQAYAIVSRSSSKLSFVTFQVPAPNNNSRVVASVRHPLEAPDSVIFYSQVVPLPSGNVAAVGNRKVYEYGPTGGKPVSAKPLIDLDALGLDKDASISAATLEGGEARGASSASLLVATATVNFTLWRAPLSADAAPTRVFDFSSQNVSGAPDSSLTLCGDGKTLYFTNVATSCVDTLVLSDPPTWTPSVWCMPGQGDPASPSLFGTRMTKLAGAC
jgi:hypothetical protein